jgi:hypothetical protein
MIRSQWRWLFTVLSILLWVALVYAGYYVVHRPVDATTLRALANGIADILTWLGLMLVATALGSRLTRTLAYHSLLERLAFSSGLGLALVSLLTLVLSLVGLLYGIVLWALLLGGGLALWPEIRRLRAALRERPRGPALDRWSRFLLGFVILSLVLVFLLALAPPAEWDALTYHLVGPARYLAAHRLTYEFDNYYLFFPAFSEMLFTTALGLKGDIVAHLVHFSYLALTLGALVAFADRHWNRRTGLLAAALFAAIPTALQIAAWAYVDLVLTFYSLIAFYALFQWLQEQASERNGMPNRASTTGWLVLAGIFGGAAASIKYTGVTCLLSLGAVLFWALLRRRITTRQIMIGLSVITGLSLALAAPWYIKNLLVTGNPIYPLIWGGTGWNEISTRWLLVLGEKKTILDLLLIPWTLTVLGTQGTVAYDATFSPLHLGLLPLWLFVRRRAEGVSELFLVSAVGYVAWIASAGVAYGEFVLQGRMVLPVFAPLSLLCALAWEGVRHWDRGSFSLHAFLKLVIVLTLTVTLLSHGLMFVGRNPLAYLVGYQSRADYLDRFTTHGWNEAMTYLAENRRPGDNVLFFWEPRGYGCAAPCEADVLFDNFSQLLARYHTVEGILTGLQQEGVTLVLVNEAIFPHIVADYPLAPQEATAWEEWQARVLTDENAVYRGASGLTLYRLPSVP